MTHDIATISVASNHLRHHGDQDWPPCRDYEIANNTGHGMAESRGHSAPLLGWRRSAMLPNYLNVASSFVATTNHRIVPTAVMHRVPDCVADCIRLVVPQPTKWGASQIRSNGCVGRCRRIVLSLPPPPGSLQVRLPGAFPRRGGPSALRPSCFGRFREFL